MRPSIHFSRRTFQATIAILSTLMVPLALMTGCGSDNAGSNSALPGSVASPQPSPSVSVTPSSSPSLNQVRSGQWGGLHAGAQVTDTGATFQFECAQGVTKEALILDSSGAFQVQGSYTLKGGPIVAGEPRQYPATYSGTVTGDSMSLNVRYTDSAGQVQTQTFQLTFGKTPTFVELCALARPSPAPGS